jgi:hypothetical protein
MKTLIAILEFQQHLVPKLLVLFTLVVGIVAVFRAIRSKHAAQAAPRITTETVTPESIDAALRGDLTPIDQEAAVPLVPSSHSTLPKRINHGNWEQLESQGVRRLGKEDNLFVEVQLPPGWQKKTTEHPMWFALRDDKGRQRASIFFKDEIYHREAFMIPCARYNVSTRYSWDHKIVQAVVLDGNQHIHESRTLKKPGDDATFNELVEHSKILEDLRAQAASWLDERFPDWKNPGAYWN